MVKRTKEGIKKKAAYDLEYAKKNVKQIIIKLNKNYDSEIIEHIAKQENVNQYFKKLIIDDMKKKSK